jgi:hypothetical protein
MFPMPVIDAPGFSMYNKDATKNCTQLLVAQKSPQ